jgi:hypothetical protein
VDGAITINIFELKGKIPVGLNTKNTTINWSKEDLHLLSILTDQWLPTLNPTHRLNELPLENYIQLSFKAPNTNEKVVFYIPNTPDKDAYKNIYLKGHDNGETKYYLIKGSKNATNSIIHWYQFHSKKYKGVEKY